VAGGGGGPQAARRGDNRYWPAGLMTSVAIICQYLISDRRPANGIIGAGMVRRHHCGQRPSMTVISLAAYMAERRRLTAIEIRGIWRRRKSAKIRRPLWPLWPVFEKIAAWLFSIWLAIYSEADIQLTA